MASTEIGARLKVVRGALSQREFADRLGTSSGRVSELEAGRAMPGGDFLVRLYREFNTDITWLLVDVHSATHGAPALAAEIQELVDQFTRLPSEEQAVVRRTVDALFLAAVKRGDAVGIRRRKPKVDADQLGHPEPHPSPPAGSQPRVHEKPAAQVFHGPVGQAGAGDIVNHAPVTIRQRGK